MPTIFLAGAAGAIGRRLVPLLRAAGHTVVGTTRSEAKAHNLRAAGATPVVVDVFNADALARAVADARPAVVIHQLTDLPAGLDPARMADAIQRNARIREEGTRNLVAAAVAADARRIVAQSIGWAYASGPQPYHEDAPLDLAAEGTRAITVRGVAVLERHVTGAPLEAVVLRYGRLYGPGTGADTPPNKAPVHVDAAAHAAVLAVESAVLGIFNVAEPDGTLAIDKARDDLGWDPAFRLGR